MYYMSNIPLEINQEYMLDDDYIFNSIKQVKYLKNSYLNIPTYVYKIKILNRINNNVHFIVLREIQYYTKLWFCIIPC